MSNRRRGHGVRVAKATINATLEWLYMADEEGHRANKVELVGVVSKGTNYAFTLALVNAVIAFGYAEEIYSEDKAWVRITAKGISCHKGGGI